MLKTDITRIDWDTPSFACVRRHGIPLVKITLNRKKKHVTVEGQIVIKTCENGSLRYNKYHDIEEEVEASPKQMVDKNSSQRL